MIESISDLEAVRFLQNLMEEIPNYKVYYTMREMRVGRTTENIVNNMRACLAINSAGLPIMTALVRAVLDTESSNVHNVLHNLGDKNCLVLKRMDYKKYEWVVHPVFLKYFYGEENEQEEP